ncbi:MAG: hypothetical protein JNM43_07125 [Planctomycetaceae bacterium]|nr:hypothetical protein [Planctomycetaceae bacterium]
MKTLLLLLCLFQDGVAASQDEDEQASTIQAICGILVQRDRLPPEFSEEAVEKLEDMPPSALPHLLRMVQQMPADSHLQLEQSGGKILQRAREHQEDCPDSYLRKFVDSDRQEPVARRIALNWLEIIIPGIRRQYLLDHVSEETWRYDAVEESLLIAAQPSGSATELERQTKMLRGSLDAVTDIDQAMRLVKELQLRGQEAPARTLLGVVAGWTCQTELQSSLPVFAAKADDDSKKASPLTVDCPEPSLISHVSSRIAQAEVRFVLRTELQSDSDRRVIVRVSSDKIPHLYLNGEEISLNGAPADSETQRLHRYSKLVTVLRGPNDLALKFESPEAPDDRPDSGTDVSFCVQLLDENGKGITAPEVRSANPKTP